jgi:hypothetical protein
VVATHPAGASLLRHRAGRLSREHLGCTNVEQVFALAAGLGVTLEVGAEP